MRRLPDTQKTFEFEQATVIYRLEHSDVVSWMLPRLEVMAIDAYFYQREFILKRCIVGDAKTTIWEAHAYHHPDRRDVQNISWHAAEHFIYQFLELCEKYPSLLFNATDNVKGTPRSVGFVRLSERLLRGEPCTVQLLK
jgi:hypothetical protein